MSTLQALTVAGTQGGFATGVPEALALHFWRVMRDGQDEDSVEDAYWAAVSAEEKLRVPHSAVAYWQGTLYAGYGNSPVRRGFAHRA